MHICILWWLYSSNDIPQHPSPQSIQHFEQPFQTTTSVNAQRRSSLLLTDIDNIRGAAMVSNSAGYSSKIVRTASKHAGLSLIDRMRSWSGLGLSDWSRSSSFPGFETKYCRKLSGSWVQ